jgi:hypothetical protein
MPGRQFPCDDCGAELLFAPGTQQLTCPYCGTENAPPVAEGTVVEHDYLAKMRELERNPDDADLVEVKEVTCGACAATTTVRVEVQADSCPFCDTPFVAEPHSERVIKPHALLPFRVTSEAGGKAFGNWVSSRWFAPNKLKDYARRTEKLNGIYLPHWTYDTRTITDYQGQRGEYYWDTESYTDSDGKRKTRRVRKTRWYPASGRVHDRFDDLLVVGSDSLPRSFTEKLEPWDLPDLVPFAEEYLSGFRSEHYALGLCDGFELAKGQAEPVIRSSIRADIGGDKQRIHHSVTDWEDISFKHILLPVWVSAYRYKDTVYRVVINARTGEVQGERPYSVIKITLTVLTVIAIIAAIAIGAR